MEITSNYPLTVNYLKYDLRFSQIFYNELNFKYLQEQKSPYFE